MMTFFTDRWHRARVIDGELWFSEADDLDTAAEYADTESDVRVFQRAFLFGWSRMVARAQKSFGVGSDGPK